MKAKLNVLFIILMSVMLILAFTTQVRAEYSADVVMTPDKTEVKPGDVITIKVELANVVDAGTGANVMSGYIEYDENFISKVAASQGTWTINPETKMFLLEGNVLTEDGEYATLQLTVSDNATGSSTVKFTQLMTSEGTAEPTSDDITLTFNVASEENPGEDDNNPGDDNNPSGDNDPADDDNQTGDQNQTGDENNQTGDENQIGGNNNQTGNRNNSNSSNINTIKGNSKENFTAKTSLPKAGEGVSTWLIIGAVVLIASGIGFYWLYKRYQKV